MIRLNNINKTYGKVSVLNNLSLELQKRDYIAIVGRSGCGKSTLLNILAGIDAPSSGSFYFQEEEMTTKINELAKYRAKNVGLIVQSFALIKEMDVFHNISLPLTYMKISKELIEEQVKDICRYLEIEDKLWNYPEELSGGQCQKVAIARAIIKKPQILLADEPTGSLDFESKKIILQILSKLNMQGMSIVVVTHDLEVANQAQKIYKMENGGLYDYE